jgi:hypothetical protein
MPEIQDAAAKPSDWTGLKSRLMAHWPALDEKELEATGGDRQAIIATIEGRFGYARANAERDYDELMRGEGAIAPHDVADADTHTGTSGPVGAVSVDAREMSEAAGSPMVTGNDASTEPPLIGKEQERPTVVQGGKAE